MDTTEPDENSTPVPETETAPKAISDGHTSKRRLTPLNKGVSDLGVPASPASKRRALIKKNATRADRIIKPKKTQANKENKPPTVEDVGADEGADGDNNQNGKFENQSFIPNYGCKSQKNMSFGTCYLASAEMGYN